MWITLLIVLGFLLLASAFFSGTEAAFFSLNRVQLRRLEQEAGARSRAVVRVLSRPGDFLTTVLVGNNLVNVAISVLATTLALRQFGERGVEIAVAVTTLVVVIFGDITPKTLAVNFPERFSRAAVNIYRVIRVLLAPLVAAVSFLSDLCLRALGLEPLLTNPSRLLSRGELGTILEGADEEGVMTARESHLVQNILDFTATTAEEIMTPRIDVVAVPENLERARLEERVIAAKHSRVPVYRRTIDEVIGYLPVRDFLLYPERRLSELIRPVAVFPEQARAAKVFYEIQRARTPMVIVVNEYGETVGLLTREDLVEEVVGDIYDEFEPGQEPIRRLSRGRYLTSGQVNLEELNDALDLDLPLEDAVTLSGFLTGLYGGIPRRGERIRWPGVEFRVAEASANRIERVILRLEREGPAPAAESEETAGGPEGEDRS